VTDGHASLLHRHRCRAARKADHVARGEDAGTLVRKCSSIFTYPRSSSSTPTSARPRSSVLPTRPAAKSSWSDSSVVPSESFNGHRVSLRRDVRPPEPLTELDAEGAHRLNETRHELVVEESEQLCRERRPASPSRPARRTCRRIPQPMTPPAEPYHEPLRQAVDHEDLVGVRGCGRRRSRLSLGTQGARPRREQDVIPGDAPRLAVRSGRPTGVRVAETGLAADVAEPRGARGSPRMRADSDAAMTSLRAINRSSVARRSSFTATP